jgi:hypothetical protein
LNFVFEFSWVFLNLVAGVSWILIVEGFDFHAELFGGQEKIYWEKHQMQREIPRTVEAT